MYIPSEGVVCAADPNDPGVSGTSVNNQGLIGNSTNGRGVYGSSYANEGGYFSSTDGDGVLAYSTNGFSAHFTGGKGVLIDPPSVAGSHALTVTGDVVAGLPAAVPGAVAVCGALDTKTGLYTFVSCDDRLRALEAAVAELRALVGARNGGAEPVDAGDQGSSD